MTLHDELLSALQRVATVQLVASLRDPRLTFDGDTTLHVFIPDLHLLSHLTRPRYPYGTNGEDVLLRAVNAIIALKSAEAGRRKVAVFQLGDFLDLWRETPVASDRIDAATRIADDHGPLVRALANAQTRFLLGNHDFELCRWPNFLAWERRYFLGPSGVPKPAGMALHGDVFSQVEEMPDAMQQLAVFYFSPFRAAADYDLREMLAFVYKENAPLDFTARIASDGAVGQLLQPAQEPIPDRYNVGPHNYLELARSMCLTANQQYGMNLRFAVIGHTHHPRIAVHDGGGDDFFALIDSGAWIENCVQPDGTKLPNMQLTAISNNEARVYQLGPRADV